LQESLEPMGIVSVLEAKSTRSGRHTSNYVRGRLYKLLTGKCISWLITPIA
jgi:translation elongation factor P/translation initiation factor 5A